MAKKDTENKAKKQKAGSYFKEMKAELKKVTWPTPKELLNSTVGVIAFVLIISIIVFILDFCFDNLNKYGIVKFQNVLQSSFNKDEDETDSSEEETSSDSEENTEENEENGEDTTNIETTENSETENTNSDSEE